MRSYKIFLLFLLMSISVFAGIRTRVEDVNSENYNKIKINLISITNNDVESMRIINLKEKRKESYKDYDSIQADRVELENGTKIKIGAEDYIIENNKTTTKVTGYNNIDKVQYIYGWIGTYNTYFTEEKGEERTVSFDAERVLDISRKPKYTVTGLLGTYTEPTKIEPTPESGEQYIYSQIAKENLDRTDSGGFWGIGSKYYNISFYNDLKELKSVGAGNKSLKAFLTSDESYEGEIFTQKNGKVYLYNGENRPMVEFKLTKNTGNPYNGTFKFIKHGFWETINESYKIPAPTTDFKEIDSETNVFTYTENSSNNYQYESQEVVFRLYKGNKHNDIRPIKKISTRGSLDEFNQGNDYVDFVFEKVQPYQEINAVVQTVEKSGIIGKFINGRFEIIGLENAKSYNLDFYTLRYGINEDKDNVVATYEDSLEFVGKNSNKPVETPSSQWIYSQITKANLVNSDKYTVDFYENVDTIKTIDEDGSLNDLLKSDGGYSSDSFTQQEQARYSYDGDPKSMIEFKIKSSAGEPQNGKFELTIEEEGVFKRKINENYIIPTPTNNFEEQDLELSKNTFTYEDRYELEHIKAYKYQEALFRLYTGSKHDGVRPIKRIEENDLSDDSYVDFVFENNGSTQEIEKNGIKGRFIEGKFEIIGLENDKPYKLDFYTLRYRDNDNKGNYAAVTYEGSLDFTGKNVSSIDNTAWLEDIDTSEYKKIKLNIITATTEDLRELDILNLVEKRDAEEKRENYEYIKADKIELENIWIDKKEYKVIDNQITLENTNKRYVYKWEGSYDTEFEHEKGETREVKFWSRRYSSLDETFKDELLTGKYIEPTPVEVDTGYSHQRVMFNFDFAKEFKNQNYRIEDRILASQREGYKQLKTVNYESNLDDILYGKNGHSLIKEFSYDDGSWNYPVLTSSTGLIIEKTITESKGNLKGGDGSELIFYTDKTGSGIERLDQSGDKVTYRWNEGPLNTNGEILNYDKVIFRIVKDKPTVEKVKYMVGGEEKEVELPLHYWNPYENENSINYIDETDEGNNKLEAFLFGGKNYIDLVLDATTSKTITLNNAIISYEQTNKELRIVGLPVGDYTIQFYNVKRGHDGTYKVITYENQNGFKMDIPDIASSNFEKENNVHKIDFITVGEEKGNIQVNVNFITKMERAIDLTVDNLKSRTFNIEETKEGTGVKEGIGEAEVLNLKESDMKKFLFPLDVVFVIDNSGSMQNEIDAVKNGLSAFGQELLDRGFDVKYNLITFGPQQQIDYSRNYRFNEKFVYGKSGELYPTGNWDKDLNYKDRDYMAIYKDKWFNGINVVTDVKEITAENQRKKELAELIDAFENINAVWGYDHGQENSAWGIHYAIEKLRKNGRYLSYSGEITDNEDKGYMPSQKMIIFLTDENMDTGNIGSLGYNSSNVLEKLSEKLAGEKFNGMPDNIDLNGIFHIRKRGNTVKNTVDNNIKPYKKIEITPYSNYQGSISEYYYTNGKRDSSNYWTEYDDNELPILGEYPSDEKDIYHTDFKYYNTANNFFMYEMGNKGQHVSKALTLAINNLGIIQRWDLSYLTPFNEYDGTTRTVDFDLINLVGKDGTVITREIKNLNEVEDKQYTVKEEKLALKFEDPSVGNLKLSIIDGKGTITFLGKARYTDYDEKNKSIVVEDMIKEYKLDVLDSNNKLLFSRNTDSIDMKLSNGGWLGVKATKDDISKILEDREKSWVEVINNSGEDILSYIDKARYTIEGNKIYNIEFMDSETKEIISKKLKKPTSTTLSMSIGGISINIEEEEFKKIVKDRSDTWYELNDISKNGKGLDDLIGNDFEKIEEKKYRIKLRDLGLVKLLSDKGGNKHDIELKVSQTKLTELSGKDNLGDTFGDQGWYEFKVLLTEEEMQILINSETVKTTEKINLEATIVTDLFNKTGILKNVEVDLSTPKITKVSLKNKTLFSFLDTMYSLDAGKTFSEPGKYSGYDTETGLDYTIPSNGSYGKNGDEIYLELIVEGKNIEEYDVAAGVAIDGWSNPEITEITADLNNEMKKFKVVWKNEEITDGGTCDLVAENNIENQYGFTASQDITVLKFDSEIEISPKVTDVELIDNIYYVNSDYNIDLGTIDINFRAGIGIFDYDKTQADKNESGDYYGKPNKYYKIDGENIFGGGAKSSSVSVKIDESNQNNNGAHKTDGEYKTQVYGMSRSGKLKGITDYSLNNFKAIMSDNINNLGGEEITIRVDTIVPKIKNIVIAESTSPLSDDSNYYFDISFKIDDFNSSYSKLSSSGVGGYDLVVNDGTEITVEPKYGEGNPILYKLKVNKSTVKGAIIAEVTIVAVDKAGNREEKEVKIKIPKDIKINTYEELHQTDKVIKELDKYKFTKGGVGSNIPDPAIYVTVPASNSDDDDKVGKLKIQKLDENGAEKGNSKEVILLGGDAEKEVEITFNFREGANIVRVTPISVVGVEGKYKELKFILDTKINTSYLNDEIIGELNSVGKIVIDLANIIELSGVSGYEYTFTVGKEKKSKNLVSIEKVKSFIAPTKGSISGKEEIETSGFIGGSKGTLLFTIYDKLGHKKTFEKTYFIPKESKGIIAKIDGEVKQRMSRIKIVTEGSNDKFGIESSINGSSEQEEEEEEKPEKEPKKNT